MKNDTRNIILAFLGTVLVVYLLPRLGLPIIINQVVFLLLIAFTFNSKDDIFWLAWYFIIANAPGNLFIGSTTSLYNIPVYRLLPGVVLTFRELFNIMYIIKILRSRTPSLFVFKREITLFISVALLYFALSFALGISFTGIIRTYRLLLPWSWVFILSKYLNDKQDIKRYFLLIAPFVLISLATVLQVYITGSYLGDVLGQRSAARTLVASEENLARVYSSAIMNIIALIMSVYYLAKKDKGINANFVVLVMLASSLNIFLSATRGWILFMLVLFSSFFFMRGFGILNQVVRIVVILGVLLLIMAIVTPVITSQMLLSYERFLTLELLAEGDLTAGGTLGRITDRGPIVMAAWRDSPMIGWAFSNKFYEYADIHVAHQTNLLNVGILGSIVINLIYLVILFKTYSMGKKAGYRKAYGRSALVFSIALIGLYIAHSSSSMLWGFYSGNGFFWAILLSAIGVELNPARGNANVYKSV